jgi:asparagine synthase (glutamine-hydrolysing)
MCGIAGQLALHPDRLVDVIDVRKMTEALTHRGPDDEGYHVDAAGRVALGMRRLSIIDLASGQQPIAGEDGSVVCVFNGEIYNFRELRARLQAQGHVFRSSGDTEVIVHLYEEEGPDCVRRLRGMFAIALWDARAGRLLLARDRFGKKPLYYAELEGRLCFASELGGLTTLAAFDRRLDPIALDLYLTHGYVPSPRSIYRTVRKLPPAHTLIAERGRVRIERYWRIEPADPWQAPAEEIAEALREKLRESVRLRLVSDVPLGCFLSGGIDSSAVVATMCELGARPVRTFSVGFTHEAFDELSHARAVARRFGTEHHEYRVTPQAVEVLPAIIRHFGEPFGDSSAVPTWYVAKLARQHVTVALNGDGGDELFGGYAWYRTALAMSRAARIVPQSLAQWTTRLELHRGGLAGRLGRAGRRLTMTPAERFASLRRVLPPDRRQTLYTEDFRRACGQEAERYLPDQWEPHAPSELWALQRVDMETYLAEDLMVKVDRMTMAHSLEGRSPLLDTELAEFAMRVPPHLVATPWATKRLFRMAMRGVLPAGTLGRRKMGFTMPVAAWLRGELRELCVQRVGSDLARHGWLEPASLRTLIDEHLTGARDWSEQLWSLLVLAEWAETSGI